MDSLRSLFFSNVLRFCFVCGFSCFVVVVVCVVCCGGGFVLCFRFDCVVFFALFGVV